MLTSALLREFLSRDESGLCGNTKPPGYADVEIVRLTVRRTCNWTQPRNLATPEPVLPPTQVGALLCLVVRPIGNSEVAMVFGASRANPLLTQFKNAPSLMLLRV